MRYIYKKIRRDRNISISLICLSTIVILFNNCAGSEFEVSREMASLQTPSNNPSITPTSSPTSTPTGTPAPTATPTSTPTGTPAPTATPTSTLTGTPTPTIPMITPTIAPSSSPTPISTPTPTIVSTSNPSITTASVQGSTLTISGSNFGSKSSAAPFLFENFDNQNVGNVPADFGYTAYGQIGIGSVTVDNSQSFSGGRSLIHRTGVNVADSDGVRESFPHIAVNNLNSQQIYFTYRLRFSRNNVGTITQLKFNRGGAEVAGAHGSPCYGGYPKFYESYYYSDNVSVLDALQGGIVRSDRSIFEGWIGSGGPGDGSPSEYGTRPPAPIAENTWVQVEGFYRLNDVGQSNGQYITHVNGHRNFNLTQLQLRASSSSLLQCSYLVIGIDYRLTSTNNQGLSIWYDDHYVDTTPARVVLANAAIFENATSRTPQPAISWSNSEVRVNLNTAGFSRGSNAWLYVIDNSNRVSSGIPFVVP